ncbi:restriction endonuclease subunit S [Streptococcus suis]|uniref:restriction endonuclease subunit S n=1 Tax=Streptococcus suis TaxID=1307 RepID=UPI00041051E7|nr:restriction endonuclease subunit S [Streptococcus suis]
MKTNNNILAYRFQGYTDAWELRKLGEVARFRRGSFPQPYGNSEWYDGDGAMPFVQVADVTDEMNLVGDTKQKISRKAQPLSVFAEEGSVLVTLQGSIGRVAITQYEAFIDRTVLIFENFNLPVDNLFWAYIIKQKFIEEAKCAPGGTIKTITKEVLSDFDIKLPSHPEQTTIGTFFSTLDQQITLHQRKLDTLKEQKKTYLKLLFPAKGQTKPALRFQGYTDAWELRKLGEVVEKSGSGGTPKSTNKAYYGGNIPFLSITDITQSGKYITNTEKTLTEIGLENSSAWIVPKGAISLAMYASVGKLAILKTDVATSQAFFNMVFSNEIVRDYVYFILDKAQLFNEWLPLISTGTQGNLNAQKLKEYIIPLPTLPEQEAIGTFFQTLDQEIAQVEDKLASLKEMKKTLLRKLFV